MSATENPPVETRGLTKTFKVGGGLTRTPLIAVEDVSIAVPRGETLGVVGESGSGKSTLGRLLLQLERPTAGDILFDGRSILEAKSAERRRLRKRIQVVFQDPYSSLNPTMSIGKALS